MHQLLRFAATDDGNRIRDGYLHHHTAIITRAFILLFFVIFQVGSAFATAEAQQQSLGFSCYQGIDDNYREGVCQECAYGTPCLCAKVPNFNGQILRFCRVNPHNAVAEGCNWKDYLQGTLIDHCYCAAPLCNKSVLLNSCLFVIIIMFCVAHYTK